MQTVADPYPGAAESLATDLRGELQRLRYLIKQVTGETQWYIDPDNTIAALEADVNTLQTSVSQNPPVGVIQGYGGASAPTGWLLCDGSAVSRTTYASLFTALNNSLGTVTITIAAPGVVTLTAHGLATGDSLYLTTTGALPTGLTANTRYWVVKVNADTFSLATTLANALAGTKITTSGSQSGVHTAVQNSYGVGDGSTTFHLPNLKGVVPVGKNQSDTEFAGLGQTGGAKTHTLITAEMPAHVHASVVAVTNVAATGSGKNPVSSGDTDETGGDGAHNNLQPYIALNYIIKY
ncbi:MAG: tail fiber protein [Bacteroidetes bacterium]|nr:tail fiber protein [Bacteroidota bacterium]